MTWILIACISPLLWAFNNLFDEYLGKSHFSSNGSLLIYFSAVFEILAVPVLLFFFPDTLSIPLPDILLMGVLGFVLTTAFVPYIWALQIDNSGNMVPIYQSIPVLIFLMGWLLWGNVPTLVQLLAALMIIGPAVFIGFDFKARRIGGKAVGFMLLSSLVIAIYMLLSEGLINRYGWGGFAICSWAGSAIFSMILISVLPYFRDGLVGVVRSSKVKIFSIFLLQVLFQVTALAFWFKAVSMGAGAAMVQTIAGLQPAFVLILSFAAGFLHIGSFPKIAVDRVLLFKFSMIAVMIFGVYLLSL